MSSADRRSIMPLPTDRFAAKVRVTTSDSTISPVLNVISPFVEVIGLLIVKGPLPVFSVMDPPFVVIPVTPSTVPMITVLTSV
jgi:hypothetical protein